MGVDVRFRLDFLAQSRRPRLLHVDGREYTLAEIAGAFVRFNPSPRLPDALDDESVDRAILTLERRYALHYLLDNAPFRVVNRPCAGRSNCSKPYQMLQLEQAGFHVAPWIVSNDPAVIRDFDAQAPHGSVYKACSGLRSRVHRVTPSWIERVATGTAPVVVQQYIPGCDVRVHVAGRATFGTAVESEAVDYRFAGSSVDYRATVVPPTVADLCVEFTADEGLWLSGFDFRRSQHGKWWCLEMNPVPTFLPYEAATGHPVGGAIVDYLATGRLDVRHSVDRSPLFGMVPRPS